VSVFWLFFSSFLFFHVLRLHSEARASGAYLRPSFNVDFPPDRSLSGPPSNEHPLGLFHPAPTIVFFPPPLEKQMVGLFSSFLRVFYGMAGNFGRSVFFLSDPPPRESAIMRLFLDNLPPGTVVLVLCCGPKKDVCDWHLLDQKQPLFLFFRITHSFTCGLFCILTESPFFRHE